MPNLRAKIAEANPHLPPEEVTRLAKNQREGIYRAAKEAAWRELERMYPMDFALLYAVERGKRGIRRRTPPGGTPAGRPPLCEACAANARAYLEAHAPAPRSAMILEPEPMAQVIHLPTAEEAETWPQWAPDPEPEPEPEPPVLQPAWVPDDIDPVSGR